MVIDRVSKRALGSLAVAMASCAGTMSVSAVAEQYCETTTQGPVVLTRPQAGDSVGEINDVNWFARPLPNPAGDYIVAYASHNQNYLYNLSTGKQVAIPDKSDAVATPDGRFVTVPSHYTANNTVNFYDADELLEALQTGKDGRDIKPVFEHAGKKVFNTFYQSAGVLASSKSDDGYTVDYRVMFSGSLPPTPPGFLIADYHVENVDGKTSFRPSPVVRLCPEIIDDMATPFISKDGRYIVAHDNSDVEAEASLKLFEVTAVDYSKKTTTCNKVIDFGFRAGKADFSFDNSKITFHLSSNDYITTFISGGIDAPHITDVVVVNLEQDEQGSITGYKDISRLTTSIEQGKGNYFPAFFPDGNIFYIANKAPRSHPHFDIGKPEDRRFEFHVLNPEKASYQSSVFDNSERQERAKVIGRLWQQKCAPHNNPLPGEKETWHYLSLSKAQCSQLVTDQWAGAANTKQELLELCQLRSK